MSKTLASFRTGFTTEVDATAAPSRNRKLTSVWPLHASKGVSGVTSYSAPSLIRSIAPDEYVCIGATSYDCCGNLEQTRQSAKSRNCLADSIVASSVLAWLLALVNDSGPMRETVVSCTRVRFSQLPSSGFPTGRSNAIKLRKTGLKSFIIPSLLPGDVSSQ